MNTTTASQKLNAKISAQTTSALIATHSALDAMTEKAPEHRLVSARVADEITKRLHLGTALDEIFEDMDFEGTYHEAILRAIVATGQDATV